MDPDPTPPPATSPAAPARSGFTPEHLLPVIAEPHRFRLLEILLDGAPHSAAELGRTTGRGRMATSKHLACLRTAGLIEHCAHSRDRRTTSYRLAPALLPPPGTPRTLDFGWCLLRFG